MLLWKRISCALLIFFSISLPISMAAVPGVILSEPNRNNEYQLSKYDVLNIVIVGFSDQYFNNTSYDIPNTTGQINDTLGQTKTTNGLNDILIGPDGYVNLPYAGTVKLAGLTVSQATAILTEKLGVYIKIPSMAVMVKQYGPRKVYVMGEVAKQGIYSLSSEYMNVFAALSSAGGITKRGRSKHITVVRTVDNKIQTLEVNFDRFIEKQDGTQNTLLQDGDMVFVPRSNKIDLNEDVMPLLNMYGLYHTLIN